MPLSSQRCIYIFPAFELRRLLQRRSGGVARAELYVECHVIRDKRAHWRGPADRENSTLNAVVLASCGSDVDFLTCAVHRVEGAAMYYPVTFMYVYSQSSCGTDPFNGVLVASSEPSSASSALILHEPAP